MIFATIIDALLIASLQSPIAADSPATDLPLIEVTVRNLSSQDIGSSSLDSEDIELRQPQHPQELFAPLPGVWISRGSGQEHLTAIRSPVLTGAGACGAFLMLENQVAIRPAGFCNVNQLFEVDLAAAQRVDVLAGPGLPQHGANALHGVIDVSQAPLDLRPQTHAGLEIGEQDFYRLRLGAANENFGGRISYTDSGSFRDQESYQHLFLNARHETDVGEARVTTSLNGAYLDQETAGFIFGFEAYLDPELRRGNVNPEAFREADALRLINHWQWHSDEQTQWNISAYARRSRLEFLQHFLPGQPLERNGQVSVGLNSDWSHWWNSSAITIGLDVEWFDGFLEEFQDGPVDSPSAFLVETRPAGAHYDYDVIGYSTSGWLRFEHQFANRINLDAGFRLQWLGYDYTNNLLDGNTRDDGTQCGFGGCLFTRPADRSDDFFDIAPSVSISGPLSSNNSTRWSARIARGFRPPQATELYRLQNGQTVADLDSETLDSVSVGINGQSTVLIGRQARWAYALTGFYQRTRDQIFRNSDGFNVTDAATRAVGVEWLARFSILANLQAQLSGSYADHEYASDSAAGSGEALIAGNQVDTAPLWQGYAQLDWQPQQSWNLGIDFEWLDGYFLNAANTARYPGHALVHLRGAWQFHPEWRLHARVRNLFNNRYAERADFAFGNFRYFPGQGTTLFVGIDWRR